MYIRVAFHWSKNATILVVRWIRMISSFVHSRYDIKKSAERKGKIKEYLGSSWDEGRFAAKKYVSSQLGYNRGKNFSTLSPAGQVVLERAKKERGVSTPLRLRTPLVHKSRSRGRSVRVILGGLKVSGEKEATRTARDTQI